MATEEDRGPLHPHLRIRPMITGVETARSVITVRGGAAEAGRNRPNGLVSDAPIPFLLRRLRRLHHLGGREGDDEMSIVTSERRVLGVS